MLSPETVATPLLSGLAVLLAGLLTGPKGASVEQAFAEFEEVRCRKSCPWWSVLGLGFALGLLSVLALFGALQLCK